MESLGTETEEESAAERAVKALNLYYLPFLVFAGSAGNLLSIAVIRSSEQLRRLSASVYLCALAISDTVFLIIMLLNWLTYLNDDEDHHGVAKEDEGEGHSWIESFFRGALFPYVVYASNVSTFLSAWLVLAFTAERFVAVRYPLKRASMCTIRRARLVLSVLVIFSLAAYLPWVFIAEPTAPSQGRENFDPKNGTFATNGSVENEGFENVSRQSAWANDWTAFSEGKDEEIHGGVFNVKADSTTISIDGDNETRTVKGYTTAKAYDDPTHTYNTSYGEVLNIMDVVLAFVVPCLGIATLNVCIVCSMRSAVKWQNNRDKSGYFRGSKKQQLNRKTTSFGEWRSSSSKYTASVAIETVEINPAVEGSPSAASRTASNSMQISTPNGPPSNFDQPPSPVKSMPSSPSGDVADSVVIRYPTCLPGQHPCPIRASSKYKDGNQTSRSHIKITGMLLVVSTAFLVLNAPSYVIRAIAHRTITQDPLAATNHLTIPQRFTEYLFQTNFGINFVLYCVFGRNFRRALRTLFFSKFLSRFCRVHWRDKYSSIALNGGKAALSGGRTTNEEGSRRRRRTATTSSCATDGKRSSWVISDWSRRSTLFSWVASTSEVKGVTED